ncbi:YeiH family protein [Nesterenkonia alba]|uniref:YeiH family protein n=1 Tax=Nesterenkonia alba TaxID=515814 RepID=UPI0003B3D06A|nr:putative sulfate exporter family transporter [Nesterenkonia alba]
MSQTEQTETQNTGEETPQTDDAVVAPQNEATPATTAIGVVLIVGLATLVFWLTSNIPSWAEGTFLEAVARPIEFPVYAIIIGFTFNALLHALGVHGKLAAAFRTELYIKTGLVLLGATVNINVIIAAALPSILQALILITTVFLFTWWFAGLFGLEKQLRALLASALSICGVSAAVAAAGAVQARKEQLAYVAGLVIVFAVPMIFLLPWLVDVFNLDPAVAGAWIGGNIDTTAAVTAAGTIAGPEVLEYATIVKLTQNALIGIVAIALSLYFTLKIAPQEQAAASAAAGGSGEVQKVARPGAAEVWRRFPKFVLGFLVASVLVSTLLYFWPEGTAIGDQVSSGVSAASSLQTLFFTLAFVSIGLEFKAGALKEAGWKPILVFFAGTVMNLIVGLAVALLLFGVVFAGWLS